MQQYEESDNEKDWVQDRFTQVLPLEFDNLDQVTDDIQVLSKVDKAIIKARQRNELRIRMANERDASIVGKFLPPDAKTFFPRKLPIIGPDDFRKPSGRWLEELREVVNSSCPMPTKPEFEFDISDGALFKNKQLMERAGWDMEKLILSQKGSTAWHGSEFQPNHQLKKVIGQHPSFGYIKKIVSEGMNYNCSHNLSEEEQVVELKAQLERGNHKPASGNTEELKKLLLKDVTHGFSSPNRAKLIHKIKGAMVQPCGMVSQFSLQADGSRKKKNRLTHDLSFLTAGGFSQ